MIGRRCKHSNVFSRPVLIARNLSVRRILLPDCLSQVKYCGGYSGEDPPLPIPNREVKLTSADGTAPPGGRVGSCRFSKGSNAFASEPFFFLAALETERLHHVTPSPNPFPRGRGVVAALRDCEGQTQALAHYLVSKAKTSPGAKVWRNGFSESPSAGSMSSVTSWSE